MNGGLSGFHNAPVTRAFVTASALLSVVFAVRGRSTTLGLSYQDFLIKLHLWRVIGSVFAFSSTPELMFGLYLLYYFRVFERQIGSNKHSVFILFSLIMSLLLEVLGLMFLTDSNISTLASGPYGLIFASFVPFYFDIPVSSWFRLFGINFTDKLFIYLAGFQLLLSSWKRSLVPGMCGLLAGTLYRLNIFGIRRITVIYIRHSEVAYQITLLEAILLWQLMLLCPSHLNHPLPCWYLWASTGMLPDKHSRRPEMTSMQRPISSLKHNPVNSELWLHSSGIESQESGMDRMLTSVLIKSIIITRKPLYQSAYVKSFHGVFEDHFNLTDVFHPISSKKNYRIIKIHILVHILVAI